MMICNKNNIHFRIMTALMLVSFLITGCASPPLFVEDHRMARYRPDVPSAELSEENTLDKTEKESKREEVKDRDDGQKNRSLAKENQRKKSLEIKKVDTPEKENYRYIERGDELTIFLTGIPQPQELVYVVDDRGRVNLPFIGSVSVDGKSTAETETLIERAYIRGGYYKKINIIVVPQKEEYFVQGEVRRQDKYFLSGDLTLLQAISEAGGYTPYANRKKIKVIRDGNGVFYNGKEIEEGEQEDPIIKAGDIIVVWRRWY